MHSCHGTYPVAKSSWHPKRQVPIMPNKIIWGRSSCLRYVGVLWLMFHPLPTSIDYMYTTRLVLHQQIYNETSANTKLKIRPPWFWYYNYWRYVFVDFFTRYISPPNYVHYECRVDIHIWRHNPICFKHVSLCCLLFDSHPTAYQSNIEVQLRKRATYINP
jgi:hypothetical protein